MLLALLIPLRYEVLKLGLLSLLASVTTLAVTSLSVAAVVSSLVVIWMIPFPLGLL